MEQISDALPLAGESSSELLDRHYRSRREPSGVRRTDGCSAHSLGGRVGRQPGEGAIGKSEMGQMGGRRVGAESACGRACVRALAALVGIQVHALLFTLIIHD